LLFGEKHKICFQAQENYEKILLHEFIGWDSGNAERFVLSLSKGSFELAWRLPKAEKRRILVKREELGRILVPEVPNLF
jgi:hypothetical protein